MISSTLQKVANPLGAIGVSARSIPLSNGNGSSEAGSELYGLVKYPFDWIDFGATGEKEVYQNVKYIILTPIRSVVLDREFGMDLSMVDKPIPIAELMFTQEVALKIPLYESRCFFEGVNYTEDYLNGHLNPDVKIAIISTEELPSLYPSITIDEILGTEVGAPFVSRIQEIEFRGSIVGQPGTSGPPGPPGESASVDAGNTFTTDAGTQADVVNTGTKQNAVFDFYIPKGDKGDRGQSITIKGMVPTYANLPTTGNTIGDIWITDDTGHGWVWDGVTPWVDIGPIQGPPGNQGPPGTPGLPAWSLSVYDFTVPAVGSTVVVTLQDTSWVAVNEYVYVDDVATNTTVILQVTAKTATTVTLLNPLPTGVIQGPPGQAGTDGTDGNDAYTLTSLDFVVPPIGQTANLTVDNPSWIVLGETVYLQDGAGPGQALALQVVGINGNVVTLLNPATSNVAAGQIPIADTLQDGLLRKVSGLVGDYVGGDNRCHALPSGLNPPIADATQDGYLRKVSGIVTDYVGGDNACHPWPAAPPLPCFYGTDNTNVGDYVVTVASSFQLVAGAVVYVAIAKANSANPRLNVNSTGFKAIFTRGGNVPLSPNELAANKTFGVMYDGSFWRVITPIVRIAYSLNVTNPTIECAGYDGVNAYILVNATGYGQGITLAHLSPGVPVLIDIINTSGAALPWFLNASDPGGTTLGGTYWIWSNAVTGAGPVRIDGGAGAQSMPNGNHMFMQGAHIVQANQLLLK